MAEAQARARTGDAGEIICGCADLTRAEFERVVASDPSLSFEDALTVTGSGRTCTACVLDLEYAFVTTAREGRARADVPAARRSAARRSLKARLYGILDRIGPMVPFAVPNWIPVLRGPGIEQWLWLVNHGLMFGDTGRIAPCRLHVRVRDGEGRLVDEQRRLVEPGQTVRLSLSEHLPAPVSGLAAGSAEILRSGTRPAVRGTTRPHFQILTPRAACTLHSQAAGMDGEEWLETVHRPGEDRLFLTAVNAKREPLALSLEYPVGAEDRFATTVAVPPLGARVHEVVLPEALSARWAGRPFTLHARMRGTGNVHAVTASPALDRIAIDHL